MMPVYAANLPSQPAAPLAEQHPARTAYAATCHIVRFLYAVFVLSLALASLICGLTYTLNTLPTLSFFSHNDSTTGFFIGGPHWPGPLLLFCAFLFSAVLQSFLTLALHCVELLVNVSRDEAVWRRASSENGAALTSGALRAATSSWTWVVLFALKPVSQWLFVVGILVTLVGQPAVNFNAVPLFVLAGAAAVLVIFAELLVRKRTLGPQPAAYGHLQTLVDLVDDWGMGTNGKLWWGEKVLEQGEVLRRAGTSAHKAEVGPVNMGCLYS